MNRKVYYLDWFDEYDTGIQWIDDEHKKIIRISNDILSIITQGANPIDKVQHLFSLLEIHFMRMERFLHKVKSKDIDCFKTEHEAIKKEFLKCFEKYSFYKDISVIIDILEKSVISHIRHDIKILKGLTGQK